MTFHYKADMAKAKELTFLQVPGTATYMCIQENSSKHNAFLITRRESIAL